MVSRSKLRDIVPSIGSVLRRRLPSTGSSWSEFPGFIGTTQRSDSLSPYRFARSSLTRRFPLRTFAVGVNRVSQVPGEPAVQPPRSTTPPGPVHQVIRCSGVIGAYVDTADSREECF
jgi:hypothetical protein